MPYSLRTASPAKTRAEAVVVGVLQGAKGVELATGSEEIAAAYGRRLRGLLATLGVKGAPGEVTRVPTGDAIASPLLVLVGLGEQVTTDGVRRAEHLHFAHAFNTTHRTLQIAYRIVAQVLGGHGIIRAYQCDHQKEACG